mgnify:CR=1 FL=1
MNRLEELQAKVDAQGGSWMKALNGQERLEYHKLKKAAESNPLKESTKLSEEPQELTKEDIGETVQVSKKTLDAILAKVKMLEDASATTVRVRVDDAGQWLPKKEGEKKRVARMAKWRETEEEEFQIVMDLKRLKTVYDDLKRRDEDVYVLTLRLPNGETRRKEIYLSNFHKTASIEDVKILKTHEQPERMKVGRSTIAKKYDYDKYLDIPRAPIDLYGERVLRTHDVQLTDGTVLRELPDRMLNVL